MSDGEEMFGPPLPPNLRPATNEDQPPTKKIIGPVIPTPSSSNLDTDTDTEDSDSSSSDSEPDTKSNKVIGPARPSDHGRLPKCDDTDQAIGIGPSLAAGYMEQSGNDIDMDESIGPRPPVPGQQGQGLTAAEEFEERARKMKDKLIHGVDDNKPVARESWMTELPSVGIAKHMGLVARKLGDGCKVKDEDQSIWTDTPSDKQRKAKEGYSDKGKKRKSDPVLSTRDKYMAEQVEAYNKEKRAKTLLELHQKKLKKKSKEKKKKDKKKKKKKKGDRETDEVKPRRPFDRDSDLNVNRFDDAKRKLLIKRSQELNSKFGHGGQQFL